MRQERIFKRQQRREKRKFCGKGGEEEKAEREKIFLILCTSLEISINTVAESTHVVHVDIQIGAN